MYSNGSFVLYSTKNSKFGIKQNKDNSLDKSEPLNLPLESRIDAFSCKMAENPHPSGEVTYKAVSETEGSTITVGGTEFEILEFISSGGSAEVYKAVQKNKQGQSPVAIKKVSLNQPRTIDKFLEEVNLLDRMKSNPRVVQLIAHEESKDARGNKFLFEVMELGDDDLDHYLADRMKKMEYLTDQEIKGLWLQMLQAVHSIHSFGVIHLDLKPANFILVNGWVKIIDFGLSMAAPKPSRADLPSSKPLTDLKMLRSSTCGTLVYAAPEVLANNTTFGGLHLVCN